ncbi:MAG: hypothetical protein Q8P67_11910, partial [archaeon]|nr:hypothetical protein [archaeon]
MAAVVIWSTGKEEASASPAHFALTHSKPFTLHRDRLRAGEWRLQCWCSDKHLSWKLRQIKVSFSVSSMAGDLVARVDQEMKEPNQHMTLTITVLPHQAPAALTISATSMRLKEAKWFAFLSVVPSDQTSFSSISSLVPAQPQSFSSQSLSSSYSHSSSPHPLSPPRSSPQFTGSPPPIQPRRGPSSGLLPSSLEPSPSSQGSSQSSLRASQGSTSVGYLDAEQIEAQQISISQATRESINRRLEVTSPSGKDYLDKADSGKLIRPFLICVTMDALMRLNVSRILSVSIKAASGDPLHESWLVVGERNLKSLCAQGTSAFDKTSKAWVSWRDLLVTTIDAVRARSLTHKSLATYQEKARLKGPSHGQNVVRAVPVPGDTPGALSFVGDSTRPLNKKAIGDKFIHNMPEALLEAHAFAELAAYQQTLVLAAIDVFEQTGGKRLKFKLKPWRIEAGRRARTVWQQNERIQELFRRFRAMGWEDGYTHLHLLEMAVKSQIDFSGSTPADLAQQVEAVKAITADEIAAVIEEGRMFGIRSKTALNKPKLASEFVKGFCLGLGVNVICPLLGNLMDMGDVADFFAGGSDAAVCAVVLVLLLQRITLLGQAVEFDAIVLRYNQSLHASSTSLIDGGKSFFSSPQPAHERQRPHLKSDWGCYWYNLAPLSPSYSLASSSGAAQANPVLHLETVHCEEISPLGKQAVATVLTQQPNRVFHYVGGLTLRSLLAILHSLSTGSSPAFSRLIERVSRHPWTVPLHEACLNADLSHSTSYLVVCDPVPPFDPYAFQREGKLYCSISLVQFTCHFKIDQLSKD